ncbi:MAG: M48 family metalloprotease [Bryobacteraceae bacterium]
MAACRRACGTAPSRQQEEGADAEARRVFEQARMDPCAMARVYRMLDNISGDMPASIFSTHLRMADRIETIEEWGDRQNYTPEPVLPKAVAAGDARVRGAIANQPAALDFALAWTRAAKRGMCTM